MYPAIARVEYYRATSLHPRHPTGIGVCGTNYSSFGPKWRFPY